MIKVVGDVAAYISSVLVDVCVSHSSGAVYSRTVRQLHIKLRHVSTVNP
jgi:hypothetical protein